MRKAFSYAGKDGKFGPATGLLKTMRAAGKILPSSGEFTVIRGQFHHPNLRKRPALKELRAMLKTGGKGTSATVKDKNQNVVFEVKRVATSVYDDPFRDAYYSSARIDAGVDYCGTGPVYAIGPGVIVNVGTPSHTSTFGNDMAVYQLTEGPAKGKYVFFAEHYNNASKKFKVGDRIDSNTKLWTMNGCIEIGWSDGRGSEAWNSGQYGEGQRDVLGDNFSDLLVHLGAKPGLTLGRNTTGRLPGGYPKSWRGLV